MCIGCTLSAFLRLIWVTLCVCVCVLVKFDFLPFETFGLPFIASIWYPASVQNATSNKCCAKSVFFNAKYAYLISFQCWYDHELLHFMRCLISNRIYCLDCLLARLRYISLEPIRRVECVSLSCCWFFCNVKFRLQQHYTL